jgi:hypothetical protein
MNREHQLHLANILSCGAKNDIQIPFVLLEENDIVIRKRTYNINGVVTDYICELHHHPTSSRCFVD